MIESNALDHGGLQEIPEHRIGSEYRFSVFKRLRSQPSSIMPLTIKLSQPLIGLARMNCGYIEKKIDTTGKVWLTIKQGE